MPHYAPAPDVRYVGLVPGPNFRTLTFAAGGIGLSSIGLALGPNDAFWSFTSGLLPIGVAAVAGVACTVGVARQWLRLKAPAEAREVHMAIVPWGIIVHSQNQPRILHWPAVRNIDVTVKHTLQGGTPSIVSSVVTVRTEREAFAGFAHGAVGLETLMANVEAYAQEASRPVSADLDGHNALGDDEPIPLAVELLRSAQALCSTGRGACALALPPGGYRWMAASRSSPETLTLLGRVLEGDVPGAADPRPLAALVVALLDAKSLGPTLVRLANRPHPLVAAVARSAAQRLGVPLAKAGSLDEVSDFLSDDDRDALGQFAAGVAVA